MTDHPTFDDPPTTYRELLIKQETERQLYAMQNPLRLAEYEHEMKYFALQRVEAEYKELRAARRAEWEAAAQQLKAAMTDDPGEAKAHLQNAERILRELDHGRDDDDEEADDPSGPAEPARPDGRPSA